MSQSHTDSVTGRALTLYLADGKMTGVVIAKLDNWSGRALVAPYTAFQSLKQRDEYKKSGVYFLMGDDDDGSFVYVGESGDIGTRIEQHNKRGEIDFDRICFFVSMDETLTQGQTCYLEYRLIKMIRERGKSETEKCAKRLFARGHSPRIGESGNGSFSQQDESHSAYSGFRCFGVDDSNLWQPGLDDSR